MMKLILPVIAVVLTSTSAFLTPPTPTFRLAPTVQQTQHQQKLFMSDLKSRSAFSVDDVTKKISEAMESFDISSLTQNSDKIRENVFSGEFASIGGAYVAAQAFLMLSILLGGVPIIGDTLMLLLGPGLLVGGAAVMVLSVSKMGSALTPWPKPVEGSSLLTDDIYSFVRHPMYAGLLAACAGFSILTGSATRLLLTALLLYSFELKTDYEEELLEDKYPEYADYKEAVPDKFFPTKFFKNLSFKKSD